MFCLLVISSYGTYSLGCPFRERQLAIASRGSYYSLKAPQQMGDSWFRSNMAHSYLATLFNLLLYVIHMFTLINHGELSLWIFFSIYIHLCTSTFFKFYLYNVLCFRGNISLLKLMFKMFTQFHNFMEVCMACWIWPNKWLNYYVFFALVSCKISSSHWSSNNIQVEYLPVVYPPEIKQENALHFAEDVSMFNSNKFLI